MVLFTRCPIILLPRRLVLLLPLTLMILLTPALAYEKRFNCGGEPHVDVHGHLFEYDSEYTATNGAGRVGGWALGTWKPVGGTPDPELYSMARFNWDAYRFDVPSGDYIVRLHFADFLSDGPGFRIFDIAIEDSLVLDDYDVIAEVQEPHYAITRAFRFHVDDGQLNVAGEIVQTLVHLSAVEVISWPEEVEPPVVPDGLVVWPSYGRISLDWHDGADIDLAGYILERSESAGGPYVPVTGEPIRVSRYHDADVVIGQEYFYRLAAVDVWNNASDMSGELSGDVRESTSSALPVYGIEMDPVDYHDLLADPLSDAYKPATFMHAGQTWENVGVRFRGRISRHLPKKSWKVKFNEFVPGQRFLDDQEELNLNAHHGERTLLRETLAYAVNHRAGVPASDAMHVHLQLNDTCLGVFTEAEQVDERWLERRGFNSSGNLYKSEFDGCLEILPDSLQYAIHYDKKTNQGEGYDDLIAFIELIGTTTPEELYHALAPIFDIEGFINFYATQISLGNDSFYCHNYYLYHDLTNDMWHYLPWDLDSTFGHLGVYEEGIVTVGSLLKGYGANELITRLHDVPHFRRRYLERTLEVLDDILAPGVMGPTIDGVHGEMIEDARLDWHKWGWEDPSWVDQGNEMVKSFIPGRTAYVYDTYELWMPEHELLINEIMADNDTGLQDEAGDFDDWFELINMATADTLDLSGMYLTDNITMPMKWAMPDTLILPGEHLIFWADNEPAEGPTHVNFRLDYDGEFLGVFDRVAAGNQPLDTKSWGGQLKDVAYGRYPDGGHNWMKMPTPTPGAANTDAGNLPPTISGTTHVPQTVGLLVPVTVTTRAMDEDGVESVEVIYDAGAGFAALPMADDGQSGDGEAGDDVWGGEIPGQPETCLILYYVVASDSLGATATEPRDAPLETFNYQVAFVPPPLCINEFMASNDSTIADEWGEFDDWVEIFNTSVDDTVSLSGYWLSDDLIVPDQFVFPDTTLAPGTFLLVWCDNDPEQGPWHADFRLSAAGEQVGLFGSEVCGFAVIDSLTFGVQYPDTSFGRHPDGGELWWLMTAATPGLPNAQGIGIEPATGPAVPRRLSLGPTIPSPFHRHLLAGVEIPFALPGRQRVVMSIYDVQGRFVTRLADRVLEPGRYRLVWDGRGAGHEPSAAGVYFVKLVAGTAARTAKITVLH